MVPTESLVVANIVSLLSFFLVKMLESTLLSKGYSRTTPLCKKMSVFSV